MRSYFLLDGGEKPPAPAPAFCDRDSEYVCLRGFAGHSVVYCDDSAILLRYAAHAVALRTSDLDTEFFHTDMKTLADHVHDQPTVL